MRSPSTRNTAKPHNICIIRDFVTLVAGSLSKDGAAQCVVEPCLPAFAVRAEVVYQVGIEPNCRLGLGWGLLLAACAAIALDQIGEGLGHRPRVRHVQLFRPPFGSAAIPAFIAASLPCRAAISSKVIPLRSVVLLIGSPLPSIGATQADDAYPFFSPSEYDSIQVVTDVPGTDVSQLTSAWRQLAYGGFPIKGFDDLEVYAVLLQVGRSLGLVPFIAHVLIVVTIKRFIKRHEMLHLQAAAHLRYAAVTPPPPPHSPDRLH